MIDRQFLDTYLPESVVVALGASLAHIAPGPEYVERGLLWLAQLTEDDRWYGHGDRRPPWRDTDRFVPVYAITIHGLSYKDASHYLTAEGWPTGTACWYVTVECGFRAYIAAETPALAVARAVVVVEATKRWRDFVPKERPRLSDVIIQLVASGGVSRADDRSGTSLR